jgi:hypothetical protein
MSGAYEQAPLQLFDPMSIVIFLSFFSPIILATSITSLSFVFQNFKGLIYLGFLIGFCVIRNFIYMINGSLPTQNDRTLCSSIQYSKYGNPSFSAFVFSFTIMYLSFPMFSSGAANFWIFLSLLAYFFIDLYIKITKKCVVQMSDLFLNILLGISSAALIVVLMYVGGSGKYLFFNEVSSNKDVCYKPKEQTFKCDLYRNGELVGNI